MFKATTIAKTIVRATYLLEEAEECLMFQTEDLLAKIKDLDKEDRYGYHRIHQMHFLHLDELGWLRYHKDGNFIMLTEFGRTIAGVIELPTDIEEKFKEGWQSG